MNLRHLTDDKLMETTEQLVQQERDLLLKLLHHLKEIETRRLFSKLGYKSIFDYAINKLKYSGDQAARRIAAMRLLKSMPEIEPQIESGSLTLTNLSLAQTFFRKEELSKEEKISVITKIENTTTREAEKILLATAKNPTQLKPDRARQITPTQIEYKFIAHESLNEKLNQLKGLLAHKQKNSMAEIIEVALDIAIQKLTPSAPIGQRSTKSAKRITWAKAQNKCENCGSQHALEIDHIIPKALGGTDDAENLRLFCRSCNQRAAIEKLGIELMEQYLK